VIRLVHPFQALLVLPKGQQGSRGQVIHLPASPVEKLRQLLPADPRDVLLVAQEKPNGKTSTFTRLRVEKVLASLKFLKAHNLRYSHIEIREEGEIKALFDKWERGLQQLQKDEDLPQHQKEGKQTNYFHETTILTFFTILGAPSEPNEVQLPPSESALINMGGSELEKRILEANNNSPVDRRGDNVEAESYPHLFPFGFGDFTDKDRPITLTQREYVQHRLLAHPEFQRDESWAFRALNNLNQQDMARAIQYVLKTAASKKKSSAEVTSRDLLRAIEAEDGDINGEEILGQHYFMVGSAIRGTSMYFKKARRHLFSMFATLGVPDLFLTLSANDLEWLDLFHAIDSQRFQTEESVACLTHVEKVEFLNNHPAVCAEHFSNRVQSLIRFLSSPAKPLKFNLKHFFGRLEIQGRGSPHLHSVLWLEGAPKPDSGDQFLQWVDTIISAQLPDEKTDPDLHQFVQKFQVHRHTTSCGGVQEKQQQEKQQEQSQEIEAERVRQALPGQQPHRPQSQSTQSAETRKQFAILNDRASCRFGYPHPLAETTHIRKEHESRITVKGDRRVILKRHLPREQWINNYSPDILRIWRANMDLQPVTDPYAAAAYMLSYITKDEKSERSVVKEALKKLPDNPTMTQILTKIANAIITFREVSKQEAMLLMLSIPLYFSSITTLFVPCFPPPSVASPAFRTVFSLSKIPVPQMFGRRTSSTTSLGDQSGSRGTR